MWYFQVQPEFIKNRQDLDPRSFSIYIVIVILDEQKNEQLKKAMILNTRTVKINILENGCYFHVWMTIILSWELSIEYHVTTTILC